MSENYPVPWENPDWKKTAIAWAQTQLAARGLTITGEPDAFHIRPWSFVMRIPTAAETIYFKAVAPALAHEAPLTARLVAAYPDWLPELLALDAERRWMLLGDAGVTLRSQNPTGKDLSRWIEILPRYARLQQAFAHHDDELLGMAIIDRRPHTLAQQYADLLADREALLLDQPDGLTSAEHAHLQQFTPHVAAMCRDLEAYGIPLTIQHDDFHDANVFVRDGKVLFADWGDCCLGHPFSTLLTNLRSLGYRAGLEQGDPQLIELRDCYLNEWTEYGSLADLTAASALAVKLAMIGRALTWYRILRPIKPKARAEYADAVPGWLQEFLIHSTS